LRALSLSTLVCATVIAAVAATDTPTASLPLASSVQAATDAPQPSLADDAVSLVARARDLAAAASRSSRGSGTAIETSATVDATPAPAARSVVIVIAGRTQRAQTTATTVAELLAQLHVRLRAADIVSLPLSAALADHQTISITRVDTQRQTKTLAIAFEVSSVADPTLLRGRTRIVTAGREGVRREVWKLTYRNGKLAVRSLVGASVLIQPRAKVVAYGTKQPAPILPTGRGGYPAYGNLNWYALATCESGNDPHSRDGAYHGLYQFSLGTWQSVGGRGDPADASVQEQTYRAWLLYQSAGRSPWPVCGKYL
jgi:hypothetical protein